MTKLCDICGHAIPRGTDHGFGRVMVGDCFDCPVCQDEADAFRSPELAETIEREDRAFERELRRSRDLDDGIFYADDL